MYSSVQFSVLYVLALYVCHFICPSCSLNVLFGHYFYYVYFAFQHLHVQSSVENRICFTIYWKSKKITLFNCDCIQSVPDSQRIEFTVSAGFSTPLTNEEDGYDYFMYIYV